MQTMRIHGKGTGHSKNLRETAKPQEQIGPET